MNVVFLPVNILLYCMYSVDTLDKGRVHIPGRTDWNGVRFIMLLRRVHNLKGMNSLFLGFFIKYFWIAVERGSLKPGKVKLWIRGGPENVLCPARTSHASCVGSE